MIVGTSREDHISEDISRYAAKPDSYDRLSTFQIGRTQRCYDCYPQSMTIGAYFGAA
jgi:hypothetical protein